MARSHSLPKLSSKLRINLSPPSHATRFSFLPKILGLKPRPYRTALYYNIGVRVTSNVGRTTINLTNSIVKVRGFQHNPC